MIETIRTIGAARQDEYYDTQKQQYPTLPHGERLTLFEPVMLSGNTVAELSNLQTILGSAVNSLTEAYLESDDLQSLIPLPPKIVDLLGEIKDYPLRHQQLRPDYIFSPDATAAICEINARFIFNGLYVASALATYFQGRGVIPQGTKQLTKQLNTEFYGKNCVVVKGREPDYDMYYFKQHNVAQLVPPVSSQLDMIGETDAVILEIHQDELELCLEGVVRLMQRGIAVHNDPRTLFIAHDKRLLAALSDAEFLGQYIQPELAQQLAGYIVSTWVEGWRGSGQLERALESPSQYVAKLAISGKSQGYYDLAHFTDTDFDNLRADSHNIAIQQKLVQPRVHSDVGALEMAGTLPMTTDQPLGMGVQRWYEYDRPDRIKGVSAVLQEAS